MDVSARVAAIDCGTNSIRLLIAEVTDSTSHPVVRQMQIVRLGQGVDASGNLAPEAIARTVAATREYRSLLDRHGVSATRFCATSAVRDAHNAQDFSDQITDVLGVRPEVLTGNEEAELSFTGATRGLVADDVTETVVVDIGGGSTELVAGVADSVSRGVSLDVGSVRLTERFLNSDPPSLAEIAACQSHVAEMVGEVAPEFESAERLVGVAGTITTVAAYLLELPSYQPAAIHGARLALADVQTACTELVRMSVAERRALPFMHPGRADVIGAGALILAGTLSSIGRRTSELVVSESDILDGIAWSMARSPGR